MKSWQGREVQLIIAGLHAPVQEMLDRSGVTEQIGAANVYPTVLEAILSMPRRTWKR